MNVFHRRAALVVAALALMFALTPSPILASERRVYINNRTATWAWITVHESPIDRSTAGAWCIPPHQYDRHILTVDFKIVRFELSNSACRHHPILFNKAMTSEAAHKNTFDHFVIHGDPGAYDILRGIVTP
jgi:hypothetical protein